MAEFSIASSSNTAAAAKYPVWIFLQKAHCFNYSAAIVLVVATILSFDYAQCSNSVLSELGPINRLAINQIEIEEDTNRQPTDFEIIVASKRNIRLQRRHATGSLVYGPQTGPVFCFFQDTVYLVDNNRDRPSLAALSLTSGASRSLPVDAAIEQITFVHRAGSLRTIGDGRDLRIYDESSRLKDRYSYLNSARASGRCIIASRPSNYPSISLLNVDTSSCVFHEYRWPSHSQLSPAEYCIKFDNRIYAAAHSSLTSSGGEFVASILFDEFVNDADSLIYHQRVMYVSGLDSTACRSYGPRLLGSSAGRIVLVLTPSGCGSQFNADVVMSINLSDFQATVYYIYSPSIPAMSLQEMWDQFFAEWPSGIGYLVNEDCSKMIAQWPTLSGWEFQIIPIEITGR